VEIIPSNCQHDFVATFAKLLQYTRIDGVAALPFY
jgi:hypothetical protein